VLFVKRGSRPGLFAPKENVTQFRWSMAGGASGLLGSSRRRSSATIPTTQGQSPDEPPISVS